MRRYFVFSVVSLVLLLSSVNATSVSVAFPVIVSEFKSSLVLAGWVLSVYQLVAISAMPLAAKLSDVIGRRASFMLCTLLFTTGSVLCAVAPNMISLIIFRVIQGLGHGGFLPIASGIIGEEFADTRQRAIGLFTSIFPIGAILGPNLGGWMVESFGWKSVFWLNVPFGLTVLILSSWLLKPGGTRNGAPVDFIGAGLLVGFTSAFMLSLTGLGNADSQNSWILIALLAVLSVILFVVFVRREQTAQGAIVSIEIIRRKPFLGANAYNFIYGACAFGIFSLIPLYASSVYGKSVLESGIILTPRSAAMMIASAITSFFLVRWGYRKPIIIGTSIVILSLVFLALEWQGINILGIRLSPTTWLLIMMGLSGIGVGISAPAANNACIELMPDKVATITGMRGMFRQMGGSVAITINTLVLQSMSSMPRAFQVVFIALAIIMLLSIPATLVMPSSAR